MLVSLLQAQEIVFSNNFIISSGTMVRLLTQPQAELCRDYGIKGSAKNAGVIKGENSVLYFWHDLSKAFCYKIKPCKATP